MASDVPTDDGMEQLERLQLSWTGDGRRWSDGWMMPVDSDGYI